MFFIVFVCMYVVVFLLSVLLVLKFVLFGGLCDWVVILLRDILFGDMKYKESYIKVGSSKLF